MTTGNRNEEHDNWSSVGSLQLREGAIMEGDTRIIIEGKCVCRDGKEIGYIVEGSWIGFGTLYAWYATKIYL